MIQHPPPHQCFPDDGSFAQILALIQRSFSDMHHRIDPPSSMHRLTVQSMAEHCQNGEIWAIGKPPLACVFFKEQAGRLYIGKLAVEKSARHQGLARKMIDLAHERAMARGLYELELEVRIELVENHLAFQCLGFEITAQTAHEGYDRATGVTMRKPCFER